MRNIILLLTFCPIAVFSCHSGPPTSNAGGSDSIFRSDTTPLHVNNDKVYVSSNDSVKYAALYDSAKWLMYCIHCDEMTKCRAQYSSLRPAFLSSLGIKFWCAVEKGDTVEIFSEFYYRDSLACDINSLSNYSDILDGIAFDKRSGKRLYYIRGNASFTVVDASSRYVNALQPDVISFIRRHKYELNGWFKGEAERRGLI